MPVTRAETIDEIEEVRRLFREYAEFLGVDLCFQGFEEEVEGLPGKYAPPGGALLISREGREIAGCVALRRINDDVCEMKRLFVRPQFKGRGIGRLLAENIIREGAGLGYKSMRLDTLDRLKEAMRLYEALGFRRIEPYYGNPLPGVVFLELSLDMGDMNPQPGPSSLKRTK